MQNIKVGDKVKTNQSRLVSVPKDEVVRYRYDPVTKTKIGLNRQGRSDVIKRFWDNDFDFVVVKVTEKRVGVRHKDGNQITYLAYNFVKKGEWRWPQHKQLKK